MSRKCEITGKGVMSGNNVSHAHNKTRRRFLPNLQVTSFHSDSLGESFRMRVSASGIRTIEHKGGFDAWLMETAPSKLPATMRKIKQRVEAKMAEQAAA